MGQPFSLTLTGLCILGRLAVWWLAQKWAGACLAQRFNTVLLSS